MKLEKVFKVYLMRDDPVTVFVPVFLKCANEAWVLKFLLNAKLILHTEFNFRLVFHVSCKIQTY